MTRDVKVGDLVYNHDTAELGFFIVEHGIGMVLELREGGIAVVHWATYPGDRMGETPSGLEQVTRRFAIARRDAKVLRWETDRLGRYHPVCEERVSSLRPLVVHEAREEDE